MSSQTQTPHSDQADQKSTDRKSTIPPLRFPDPGNPAQTTVSRDQCVAHLKFLAALADLRDTIANTDELFFIFDSDADEVISKEDNERTRQKALAILRERRWMVYVARAVDRYTTWWERCVAKTHQDITTWDMQQPSYASITQWATSLPFGPEDLPPLDVLMVWHAHMLNPRAFLEDCIRGARMGHWATEFPWALINVAIDNENFDYNPPDAARRAFEERTQRPWDNLQDSSNKTLPCLRCGSSMPVLWNVGKLRRRSSEKESGNKVEEIDGVEFEIVNDTGYAEKNFREQCENCGFLHTHQKLRVARFHSDAQQLVERWLPMPGTLYDEHGVPSPQGDHTFPNHLVMTGSEMILRDTDLRLVRVKPWIGTVHTMMGVRDLLQSTLESMAENERKPLPRERRIALRRMMAHYWDNNSGIFALDLVGAVIRQGIFVQKMDRIDWLHSPALPSTIDRLIHKYGIFFRIMAENPSQMAVPTLDVDLAWHTHQLSAKRYFAYSTARTQASGSAPIFIDHDDKVDETRLTQGFEWTAKQYRKLTNGGIYSECTCWYCEAVRETDLSSGPSIFQSSSVTRARRQAESLYSDPNVSNDPERNAHISAHNVVRVHEPVHIRLHGMQLRSRYLRAYRRAEKRRRRAGHDFGRTGSSSHSSSPPDNSPGGGDGDHDGDKRNSGPTVWGYPYYMPYYAPYMCDPGIHGDMYACNPTCMNLASGSYGNCVAGTCGGGVAAGSCGGKGGTCAGGHAGCGGGGGIGGCGGGGGGGGSSGCGGGGGGGGSSC